MKVTIKRLAGPPPPGIYTLSSFADEHGLEMEVVERGRHARPGGEFYAHFTRVDECDEYPVLVGVYGDGATPAQAIAAYADRIAGHKIKHDDWPRGRIVRCPDRFEPEDYDALVAQPPAGADREQG